MNATKTATITKPHAKNSLNDMAITKALFTSIGDGALTTDEFGRITRINPVALKILGYKESELLGEPFIKTVVAENIEGRVMNVIDRPITQAYLTGKSISGKMYYRTKKGDQVPVAVNISPIMLNKRPIGAIEVFRDITVELEIDRMKSEFISLASHQLRTPLSAIKTYTHMLTDGYMGELNDTQLKSLETIIGATNRMNELISTLLNITRIESGTIAVNTKSLKLEEVMNEVFPELTLLADSKAITLQMKVDGRGTTNLKSDSLIIKEIFTNLVSNAIKYTPENGQVSIVIKPRKLDLLVEISDTGWGIPGDAHEKVFSKFFRGSNIIKRETSGTGLGLYLVKGLLDTLNGKIWFKSEIGKGTTFFFTLPRTVKKKTKKEEK